MAEGSEERKTEDLKELVESLREVLLELRGVLLEARNPFRKVMVESGEEEAGSSGEGEDLAPISASQRIYQPLYTTTPVPHHQTKPTERTSGSIEVRNNPGDVQPREPVENGGTTTNTLSENNVTSNSAAEGRGFGEGGSRHSSNAGNGGFREIMDVARTLWSLGEGLPPELIDEMVEILAAAGYLDERKRALVEKFLKFAKEAREKGLTPEQQVIALYTLARGLGVRDEEFEDEVFRSLVRIIGGRRWENQR
ncbi:MAG: hypothetical protein F7B20_07730 [Aeropyrum sp.]|nr:hypothetical protein [Aeropyrum sp.]MCE4616647.1 hypothetical protein [Aeropyrum sp.]